MLEADYIARLWVPPFRKLSCASRGDEVHPIRPNDNVCEFLRVNAVRGREGTYNSHSQVIALAVLTILASASLYF